MRSYFEKQLNSFEKVWSISNDMKKKLSALFNKVWYFGSTWVFKEGKCEGEARMHLDDVHEVSEKLYENNIASSSACFL